MKNSLFALLIFALFSFVANASPGSWTPYQNIQTIIIENGIALILVEGGVPATHIPPECNQPYNQAILSSEHGQAIYSMALAASMSGKKVSMALGCSGSRPLINLMKI